MGCKHTKVLKDVDNKYDNQNNIPPKPGITERHIDLDYYKPNTSFGGIHSRFDNNKKRKVIL